MSRIVDHDVFSGYFLQQNIPSQRITLKTEIVTSRRATIRFPEVMILSEELATALEGARRSTITPDMPPPLLVVEIVSPNQEKRAYRYKRSEYAARGIAEYWIVDPMQHKVTVLEWVEGLYEEAVYEGEQAIVSPSIGGIGSYSFPTIARINDPSRLLAIE